MRTTLNAIRKHNPCASGWRKLLRHLDKKNADDEPLSIVTVLDSNGLNDALWCMRAVTGYDRELRLYAVWCARQVQHLMTDPRSIAAIDVAERYAHGNATKAELAAARGAAWDAARDAAWDAAWDAARDAAWDAAWDAATDAAAAVAWAAEWDAARAVAWVVAWGVACDAQGKRLREVCTACEAPEVRKP